MKPIAPPFDEQVKALFDQFPWKKAEKVLRVLSKIQRGKDGYLAHYYNIDQLKKTASGLLHNLYKAPFETCSTSTAHMKALRDDGYYSLQLELYLDANIDDNDFFMDGQYRHEYRTAVLKTNSKPRWREQLKHFIERTTRNS